MGSFDRLDATLADPTTRRVALAAAAAVGLAASSVHWLGLLAGGALVGLTQPSLRRAAVAGLGFGVLVLVAFAATLALAGSLDAYLRTGQLLYVSVAAPLVGGLVGSLARGLR